jgi:DNA-binding LytR/AlgR family response regulator
MHWFEEHLPAGVFWHTHKPHLVNSHYVKQLSDTQKTLFDLE